MSHKFSLFPDSLQPFIKQLNLLKNRRFMRRIIYLLILPVILSACKKEHFDSIGEIEPLVGKWRLEAYEKTVNGQKTWEKVPDDQLSYLSFRFDGVILGSDGLPRCCAPKSFTLNGVLFIIEPKADVVHNPVCDLIDCFSCENWVINQNGGEIIVSTSCDSFTQTAKYTRE
jgi:hypothetical protein